MVLQPLRVVVARRHLDVGMQRGLELLLLRVRLVEQLDELGVAGWGLGHRLCTSVVAGFLALCGYPESIAINVGDGKSLHIGLSGGQRG